MKLRLLLVAVALALPVPAYAQKPITIGDALAMVTAHRNLDGRLVVVKQNGADQLVMTPWEFGSGTLRLRIAKNIGALQAIEKQVEEARVAIIKEATKGGTLDEAAANKQLADILAQPASGDLSRIRASELKLDKNEIPATTLAALAPVLDDDVSAK